MMATLDWIFAAVLLASMLLGAWRGLVYEVLSLLAWVAAFMLAQWLALDAAALLPLQEQSEMLRYAAGFITVFLVAVFACSFLAWLGKKLAQALGLRPVDRVLGAVFGALRGVLVILVAVFVAGLTQLDRAPWWQEARSAVLLSEWVKNDLRPLLPQDLGSYWPA